MRRIFLVLAALCFGYILAQAQSTAPAKDSSSSKPTDATTPELKDVKPQPTSGPSKLTLKDIGPSSPEEVARMTAKSLAEQKRIESGSQAGKTENKDQGKGKAAADSKPSADDAVMEFRPAGTGSGDAAAAVASQAKQSKSPAKQVHGHLYGAKSGTAHADGGSIGATSKSGKTSVYVESDQTRAAAPQPR